MNKLTSAILLASFILISAPVLAEETNSTTGASVSAINFSCMQTAVEKRDNAIIAAIDARYTAHKSALQTRRDALKAAWVITNAKDRRVARKTAWDAYNQAVKKAVSDFRKARQAAWKQFHTDAKACNGVSSEESAGAGVDAQL